MSHYKCIILVVAHHEASYDRFKKIWVKHLNANKHWLDECTCYFLYNDPTLQRQKIVKHDMYFPHEETYPAPGLLLKTMDALEYMRDNDITYDMTLRTNLSSLINWKAFNKFINENHTKQEFIAGVPYDDKKISGCCMFLSSDLVNSLIENRHELNFDIPDDEAINTWLASKNANLNFYYLDSTRPKTIEDVREAVDSDKIHFRFHMGWIDENRQRKKDHSDMNDIMVSLTKIIESFENSEVKNVVFISGLLLLLISIAFMHIIRQHMHTTH